MFLSDEEVQQQLAALQLGKPTNFTPEGKLKALYERIKTQGAAGLPAIAAAAGGLGAVPGLLEGDDERRQ